MKSVPILKSSLTYGVTAKGELYHLCVNNLVVINPVNGEFPWSTINIQLLAQFAEIQDQLQAESHSARPFSDLPCAWSPTFVTCRNPFTSAESMPEISFGFSMLVVVPTQPNVLGFSFFGTDSFLCKNPLCSVQKGVVWASTCILCTLAGLWTLSERVIGFEAWRTKLVVSYKRCSLCGCSFPRNCTSPQRMFVVTGGRVWQSLNFTLGVRTLLTKRSCRGKNFGDSFNLGCCGDTVFF